MKIKPWGFIKRLYPDFIWEIEDRNGIFLTFDDGPTPGMGDGFVGEDDLNGDGLFPRLGGFARASCAECHSRDQHCKEEGRNDTCGLA